MTPVSESWFHPAFVLLVAGLLLSLLVWRRSSGRRAWQVASMSLFICLLWLAAFNGRPTWPVDLYLASDPLLAAVHTLAGRVLVPLLLLSLLFVVLALLMGRIFCSHLCPLGVLLDVSDHFLARPQRVKENRGAYRRVRPVKLVLLLVLLGAALFGFDLLGFADPLVIMTRFTATLFYPALVALADASLQVLRPLGASLGWLDLAYLEIISPTFDGALLMLGLLLVLLLLGRLQPRFWCRHLCPLGGLLGLLGRRAPYRRRVDSDKCNACNRCVRLCPTGAIHLEGKLYDRSECITCLNCVRECPEGAVSFSFGARRPAQEQPGVAAGRRLVLGGLLGGAAAGLAMRIDGLHPGHAFLPLPHRHGRLIRPPGAVPEPEFLARCTRCGECLRACLTNTLQPDWYRAGLEGLWAPHLALRHAACEQTCNVCGQVCPTGAIRPLTPIEKQHAKIGTAVIVRDRCLPWSQDRRCLICDEQCPYNAIVFRHDAQHHVGLPVVNPNRCNGCGQCEDKCPVLGEAAIIVVPQGELRLSSGSYVAEARALGLVFEAEKGEFQDQFRLEGEEAAPGGRPPAGQQQPGGKQHAADQELPRLPPGIEP